MTFTGALGSVAQPSIPGIHLAPSTSLRSMLNPTGGENGADARELAAGQQAFAAAHYGQLGLGAPQELSAAIQSAAVQAGRMPASSAYAHNWTLRGPSRYYANDASRSGDIVNLGFQNLSGRVTTIATTAQQPSAVWIGTADGGVWRSTNKGKSWTPVFDRQSTLAIGSIAVDPTNPKRVYVGTGEANTNADAYYGNGMYVTDDSGRTWRHVYLPGVLTVFHVEAVPPSAGYRNGRVFAATSHGLWLSTDHGRHYTNVALPTNAAHNGVYNATPFGNFVTDVRVRPHHANEVVAVVGWRGGKTKQADGRLESVGNGFYESTRSGAKGSFHFVTQSDSNGLGGTANDANALGSSEAIGRTSLAYSADGKYLWAVVQDAGNFRGEALDGAPLPEKNTVLNGVYLASTGEPNAWTVKGNSQSFSAAPGTGLLVEQALLYAPGVQSWYDQWITVDPSDDSRVLVGLEEVYEAINNTTGPGLAQWRTVSRYWNGCAALSNVDCSVFPGPAYAGKATHPDQHAVAFARQQNGQMLLYTGSDGGVFSQLAHNTDLGYTGYDNSSWNWLNLGVATTQPYYAVEGSDGTIYAGLQDNGEVKIGPGSTRGDEVFGGDGFDTAVVPGNSNIVYEEYTYGDVSVSTDGGKSWTDIEPGDVSSTTAQFATPFLMDPKNPNHIVEVGRYVDEDTKGPNVSDPCYTVEGDGVCTGGWTETYDLGASKVANDNGVTGAGVNNVATAVSVDGAAMYVPFCGVCDPITQATGDFSKFHNGIATNVKKGCTAKVGDKNCWHKAAAKGLPNRYIQGVAIDPRDHRTVYVTLSGYLRRWYPNGTSSGAVYVSHDAGEHFKNVSGNLPKVPGNAVVLRNGQVFIGTDLGVYTAREGSTHWTRVGGNLPNSSVLDLRLNPNGSQLVAALHGRGVWTYSFGSAAAAPYRQHGVADAVPLDGPGSGTPTSFGVRIRPWLLTPGLILILATAMGQVLGRRRRIAFAI